MRGVDRVVTKRTGTVDKQARRSALKLHGLIAREVAGSILSGRYKPGDLLDGEVASSLHRQVSRTTYREAMKIVMAKGLVRMVPRAGTTVTPSEDWHWLDPEVSSWLFEYQINPSPLLSLFELRRAVEPEAAALAAQRRTTGQLLQMEVAITGRGVQAPTTVLSEQAQETFWAALYESAGNVYLCALGKLLAPIRQAIPPSAMYLLGDTRDVMSHYRSILTAIAAADGEHARKAALCLIEAAWKPHASSSRITAQRSSST